MKEVTEMYDDIWNNFSNDMVEEAEKLLFTRLTRNNMPIEIIKDKFVLDMGCGSGRYSVALKKLGARKVIGMDKGEGKKQQYEGVEYITGDVSNIPFEDNKFDFVFCNGVLHHTNNTKKGIEEAYRVLKKDGYMWLYLVGKSKIWEMIDTIRNKMTLEDSKIFRKVLELLQFPKNKQFFLTDIFFVQHREYFTRKQVENMLREANFKEIRFLDRGVDYDFNERIYYNPELKEYFGEGDLRFIAKK